MVRGRGERRGWCPRAPVLPWKPPSHRPRPLLVHGAVRRRPDPSIVIARNGAGGLTDDTPYNHYSLLRTIEQVWNLGYLGYAADGANVSSMTRLLQH